MRAVLISLPQWGEGVPPTIAGKTIAERQLLFARQCRCEAVIAHGGGASGAALALRNAVEKAGLRYQLISSSHALPGAVRDDDSLLVLQPNLLPESQQALDLLRAEGDRMLVISAGPGTAAGFERIDLDRAWGGAMIVPGRWLGRLHALPEDAAPHAALLRIALQQRLPEARLQDGLLDDGRWMVIRDAGMARQREASWLQSHLGVPPIQAVSRWLAARLVVRAGRNLLERAWSQPMLLALCGALLAGSVAAATQGVPALAFALIALAAPTVEGFLALSRLAAAPFGGIGRFPMLRRAVDAALLTAGALAVEGPWYRAAFIAFVLLAGLWLLDRAALRPIVEPLRDRGVVALTLAGLALLLPAEPALIAIASLCLAASLVPGGRTEG